METVDKVTHKEKKKDILGWQSEKHYLGNPISRYTPSKTYKAKLSLNNIPRYDSRLGIQRVCLSHIPDILFSSHFIPLFLGHAVAYVFVHMCAYDRL